MAFNSTIWSAPATQITVIITGTGQARGSVLTLRRAPALRWAGCTRNPDISPRASHICSIALLRRADNTRRGRWDSAPALRRAQAALCHRLSISDSHPQSPRYTCRARLDSRAGAGKPTASGVQTHSPPMLPWYRPRGQQRQVVRAQELGEGSLPGRVKLVQSRVDLWRGRRLVPPESRRRAGRSGSVGGA